MNRAAGKWWGYCAILSPHVIELQTPIRFVNHAVALDPLMQPDCPPVDDIQELEPHIRAWRMGEYDWEIWRGKS